MTHVTCQEPGSAPEPYVRWSSMGYLFFTSQRVSVDLEISHKTFKLPVDAWWRSTVYSSVFKFHGKTTHTVSQNIRTAQRALSVKILSITVETSCTTNPQQIKVMELEGYSWPTCSKQPRLVDCRIDLGVVNKLDRRRRVLLTTRSTYRGEIC